MTIKIPFSFWFALYVVVAFGTFGWTFNHTEPSNYCYRDEAGNQVDCFEGKERLYWALGGGAAWPIYWGGRAALEWTK